MRHAASRRLHAHWDALRGDRAGPGRDEIDPAAIRDVLASVFLLEVAVLPRPCDAAFRMSGTRVEAFFCRALSGSTFDRIWATSGAGLAAAALATALGGRPVSAAARGGPPGREAVDVELLLLPLGSGRDRPARVLGSLAALSAPDWMGVSAAAPLEVLSLDAPVRARGEVGFGRGPAPFAVHPGGCGGATPRHLPHAGRPRAATPGFSPP